MQNLAKPAKLPNIIHLDSKELPEIKNWKPNQTYRVVMDIEMASMSFGGGPYTDPDDKGNHDNDIDASFRVKSVKAQYGGGAPKQNQNAPAKATKSDTMSALQRRSAA